MSDFINPYTLISNGILSEKDEFVIDFLGFYTIKIKIDVVPEVPKSSLVFGGGGWPTKRKKRVKLKIEFHDENIKDYEAEFYLDNINLNVSDVKMIDSNTLEVEINNLKVEDYRKNIKVIIDENKIIF
jgi:hypothetical protein